MGKRRVSESGTGGGHAVAANGGIYVESSTDGGGTWSGPTTIDFNPAAFGPFDPAYRFNDLPDMTVDADDDLYVVWIKDVGVGQPTSDIYFAKSPPPGPPGPGNPTGLDFTGLAPGSVAPLTVNDFPNGLDQANAPDVAVAPNRSSRSILATRRPCTWRTPPTRPAPTRPTSSSSSLSTAASPGQRRSGSTTTPRPTTRSTRRSR